MKIEYDSGRHNLDRMNRHSKAKPVLKRTDKRGRVVITSRMNPDLKIIGKPTKEKLEACKKKAQRKYL
jgi:hypothetical protein